MAYIDIGAFLEHIKEYHFVYDPEKDAKLKLERGINFEQIMACITGPELIDVREHHNPERFSHQLVCEVEIEGYVYLVPIVVREKEVFLKTAYPSRKATKKRKK